MNVASDKQPVWCLVFGVLFIQNLCLFGRLDWLVVLFRFLGLVLFWFACFPFKDLLCRGVFAFGLQDLVFFAQKREVTFLFFVVLSLVFKIIEQPSNKTKNMFIEMSTIYTVPETIC